MKKTTRPLSLLLAAAMTISLIPNLTSCNTNDKEDEMPEQGYVSMTTLDWKESGKYSYTVSVAEDSDITLKDVASSDFTLTATKYNVDEDTFIDDEGNVSGDAIAQFTLNNFTVSRASEKSYTFEFTTPVANDLDYSYHFSSTKAVTSDDQYLDVIFYIAEPDIYLTGTQTGAYCGSDELTLNLEFGDNGKFAEILKPFMIELPDNFDGKITFTRTSDTTATLTVNNIPTDLTTSEVAITVLASAIDSPFAKDIVLNVSFAEPSVTVERDSISIDKEAKSITFGAMYLPDGLTGEEDGIFAFNDDLTLSNVSYHADKNYYSATVTVDNADTLTEEVLDSIELYAVMNTSEGTIYYAFTPYVGAVDMSGSVTVDETERQVTITLSALNGDFAKNLTAEDFTVTGADALTNFQLKSATSSQVVFTATYAEEEEISTFINFKLASDKMSGLLESEEYSATVYVGVFNDDDRYGLANLAADLGKGALSAIGSAAMNAVLPYIYDLFGIDSTDPDIKAIAKKVDDIVTEINTLSSKIDNLSSEIVVSTYKSRLSEYQDDEILLLAYGNTLLSQEALYKYATVESDYGIYTYCETLRILGLYQYSYEEFMQFKSLTKELQDDYEKLLNKIEVFTGGKTDLTDEEKINACSDAIGSVVGHSKQMVAKVNYVKSHSRAEYKALILNLYKAVMSLADKEDVSTNYPDLVQNFVSAVEDATKTPSDYIGAVLKLGNSLLTSGAGTDSGVLEMYFSVLGNIYNFESETIEAKKAFLSRAEYVYDVNAAIAYEYCDAKNNLNKTSLAQQMTSVNQLFCKMWEEINAAEERLEKGNDYMYVISKSVSKSMNAIDITKFDGTSLALNSQSIVAITLDQYRLVVKRASALGMTVAEELTKAGFTNVTSNDGKKEYVFITGRISSVKTHPNVATEIGSIFGYEYESLRYTYSGNIFVQNGEKVSYKTDETVCLLKCFYKRWSDKSRSEWEHSYNTLLAFQAAN